MLTLGVDVGSATTQVLFSALRLRRQPGTLSSKFAVAERAVRYRSPVHLTPFGPELQIDEAALRDLVNRAFASAGLDRTQVDTGAVVVTGEAARRVNAQIVADAIAATAGEFVCVVAGHHLEAVLAAHGSGAVEASRRARSRVLNVDVGGGTTKFAIVSDGKITETGAVHAGGRLAAFDAGRRLTRLEPVCEALALLAGLRWEIGAVADDAAVKRITALLADAVVAAAGGEPVLLEDGAPALWLTSPISSGQYDAVIFSGGVSEYLDGAGLADAGDLGRAFGAALQARFVRLPGPVTPGSQRIQSTVIGASQYAVQLSGNTIFVSDESALPIHNIRAIRVVVPAAATVIAADITDQIEGGLRACAIDASEPFATMIEWHGMPTFARLDGLVRGLAPALIGRVESRQPVCLAFDTDIARIAGRMLARFPGFERAAIASVDGLDVSAFDYLDIGRVSASGTVPVTVKSLVFAC